MEPSFLQRLKVIKKRNITKYSKFFSDWSFVVEILYVIRIQDIKYIAIIPSIIPIINNFPEKNNIKKSQSNIKTLSLKKEIKKIIGGKIIIILTDLGKISFQ